VLLVLVLVLMLVLVLLVLLGMDVTAQRQAYCYRPKPGLWVLAPHGRYTHGFNWQGPGHWSALAALQALTERADAWSARHQAAGGAVRVQQQPHRIIFTGHSNGGYGAWLLGRTWSHLSCIAVCARAAADKCHSLCTPCTVVMVHVPCMVV